MQENDNLILVSGPTSTGKSASLQYINDHPGVMYLNTESNKKLPFKNDFMRLNIVDPNQIYEAFTEAEAMTSIHTIVVDSLTFLMDQYETQYVLSSNNKMAAWGDFAQYFKVLMQQYVAGSSKNVIFTAHTLSILNEQTMEMETRVPIKGSLKNNGVESYFSTVISTKALNIKKLTDYESPYLVLTEDDKIDEYKYLFQTRLTKDTINEKIRSPIGMWSRKETLIDNNIQNVIDRLHQFY